jgi:hypothetical protein
MIERQAAGKPLVRAEVDFPAIPSVPLRGWYEKLRTVLLHKFNSIARQFEDLGERIRILELRPVTGGIVSPGGGGAEVERETTTVVHEATVRTLVLAAGWTPVATGPDEVELPVPYGANGERQVWRVRRVRLRASIAGDSRSVVAIEASSDAGVFAPRYVTEVTLEGGRNQVETSGALGEVASGELVRFNVLELGTARAWSLAVEITTTTR